MGVTRYYVQPGSSTAPPAPAIAYGTGWHTKPAAGSIDATSRRTLSPLPAPTNVGGATAAKPIPVPNTTAGLQMRTPGLPAARRIVGTLRGVTTWSYIGTGALRLDVRLHRADGTLRAPLAEWTSPILPDSSTVLTTTIPDIALAEVDAEAGDVIVIEIGADIASGLGGSAQVWPSDAGTATTGDYPYQTGNPPSSSLRPWIEIDLADPPGAPTNLRQTDAAATSVDIAWDPPASVVGAAGTLVDVNANHSSASGVLVSSGKTMQPGDVAVVVAYSGRTDPRVVTAVNITAAAKMRWEIVGTAPYADGKPRYTFAVGVALEEISNVESQVGVTWSGGTAVGSMTSAVFRGLGGSAVVTMGAGATMPALDLAPGMGVTSYTTPRGVVPTSHVPAEGWTGGGSNGYMLSAKAVTAPGPHQIVMPDASHLAWIAVGPAETGEPTGYQYRVEGGDVVDVGTATTAHIEGLAPSTTYLAEVRAIGYGGTASVWVPLDVTTGKPRRPAPGIASQAVLALAGLDPDPNGADAPAQQWWDVDRLDAEHYNPARSHGLVSYSIAYGARDPLGKPQPVTVGVALLVPEEEAIEIGQRFKLRLSTTLAAALNLPPGDDVRATAIVTDAQADPMRAWHLPGYGRAILWTVTGTGWLARYGAAEVNGTGWPVETVGARIRRILDSLALTGDVDTTGPLVRPMGTVGTHHAALAAVTDSTLGRVVEQPSGRVDYHAPDDRRGILPALTLDASEILGEAFTWRQSVGDLVNSAEVTYGAGTGSKVTITDPASADPRSGVGPYPASISTILDAETAAYSLALDVVGRRAWPFYQLPAVAIDLARSGLTVPRLAVAFGLRHGDRLALSSMPNGSPWEDLPRGCFVEGYTESASAYVWRLSYVVSDPAMSGVSLRYVDVSTGITYGHVAPGLTYLDVSRIEDPAELL